MCDGGGETTNGSGDPIAALEAAVQRVRACGPAASQAALQEELIRLRRAADLLEVCFAAAAGAFDATYDENWGGYPSAINWIRVECKMSSAAAVKAVCVGEEAAAIPLSIAAVEEGRLGFAHLGLLAATAKGVRETANPAGVGVGQGGGGTPRSVVDQADSERDAPCHVPHSSPLPVLLRLSTDLANDRCRTSSAGDAVGHSWPASPAVWIRVTLRPCASGWPGCAGWIRPRLVRRCRGTASEPTTARDLFDRFDSRARCGSGSND